MAIEKTWKGAIGVVAGGLFLPGVLTAIGGATIFGLSSLVPGAVLGALIGQVVLENYWK